MYIETIKNEGDLRALLERPLEDHEPPLGEIMVEKAGFIDKAQLDEALRQQSRNGHLRLGRILIDMGLITREQLQTALALRLGIPYVSLELIEIPSSALSLVPTEIAFRYKVVPLGEFTGFLVIALSDPLAEQTLEAIGFHARQKIKVVMASPRDILLALSKYYSKFDEDQALQESHLRSATSPHNIEEPERGGAQVVELEAKRRPIVRLLNAIVTHGLVAGASDINIRPEIDRIDVYYRVDGRLQYSRTFAKALLPGLVSRVKILGRMDIAERRLPQEGNARLERGDKRVDLRLSILPTIAGESVVIRILDESVGLRPLSGLGLPTTITERLQGALSRPHGLLLVTGPTGSGKSTTLYALLNEIRKRKAHILTIEDPVEYRMDGIEQIQVNERIGIDFATTLKRFMRHDPDTIMVGEIRDAATAAIAIQAALTGHLVLSTLHTNDAPSAVTRLMDMGVEPYLVGSTLLGVIAQRLIRVCCIECGTERDLTSGDLLRLPEAMRSTLSGGLRVKQVKGCSVCRHTGYSGRRLACELMINTPVLADLITGRASPARWTEQAGEDGWRPLAAHALDILLTGETTLDEVCDLV